MRKKALSLFLAMMMLLSLVTPVSAEDGTLDVSQGSVSITENGTYTVDGYRISVGKAVSVRTDNVYVKGECVSLNVTDKAA